MATEPAALSKTEAATAFFEAKVCISDDQLERWRRNGLLPRARQVGLGRGQGSRVEMTRTEVDQAIEISRLYAIREKREWVGWQLWLRGYPVSDDYWRVPLAKAGQTLRRVRALARTFERAWENPAATFDPTTLSAFSKTPFAGPLRRLSRAMYETMIGFADEVLTGRFAGFSSGESEAERNAVMSVFGTSPAEYQSIDGQKLAFGALIEETMRDLSNSLSTFITQNATLEPSIEVRREFLNVTGIANSLIVLTAALGPKKRSFGLGTLARILKRPAIEVEAAMLLVWQGLQRHRSGLLSSAQITDLAEISTAIVNKAGLELISGSR